MSSNPLKGAGAPLTLSKRLKKVFSTLTTDRGDLAHDLTSKGGTGELRFESHTVRLVKRPAGADSSTGTDEKTAVSVFSTSLRLIEQ
jgi:hypothetical protein